MRACTLLRLGGNGLFNNLRSIVCPRVCMCVWKKNRNLRHVSEFVFQWFWVVVFVWWTAADSLCLMKINCVILADPAIQEQTAFQSISAQKSAIYNNTI